MSDESIDLGEVQDAFRQAERRFAELAAAASELESVSGQLTEARASVLDASYRLAQLAEANQSVSEQLANATRAIEATDPAEIKARLKELSEAVASHTRATHESLAGMSDDLQRWMRRQMALISVTLVAVALVGVLVFMGR